MTMLAAVAQWFDAQGWKPFEFQREVWTHAQAGQSGLLHATTGAGKTLAVWMAALARAQPGVKGLQVLWITPMRALASDTAAALTEPLIDPAIAAALPKDAQVEMRTGDSTSAQRARQAKRLPFALVTTPESLSLMLTRSDVSAQLAGVQMVVVDEWHELMGNKRGVQVQLALARLRGIAPRHVVWGLSATLGNLQHAMEVLVGPGDSPRLVRGALPKTLVVDTLLPESTERFPWGGHLGIRMVPAVVEQIQASTNSLVFTNTRSQAELWYQALLEARPDWAGLIALHHGSLDKSVREWVEQGLKAGSLKAVVCTSSLDLGVDFSPVERVLQIGSAKGVARLLQRAGRSGHSPHRPSRITLVPTNALELIEAAAAQDAVAAGRIEPRSSPNKPLDVLVQHLVSVALGEGFTEQAMFAEVRTAPAYAGLTAEEFQWCLDFVVRGGSSLAVYEEYRRVVKDELGVYRVPDRMIAKRHRLSIGTIVADAMVQVKFLTGGRLGTIEESFVGRLRKGDHFLFGGRILELIRVHEMTAYVRRAASTKGAVPRWGGGKMPLSSELANTFLDRLEGATRSVYAGPEMAMARPLLELQQRWSVLPTSSVLVAELLKSREGQHLFVYPFAGRNVHIGLSALMAWRIARTQPASLSIAVNDAGFEILSATPLDWSALKSGELLSQERLLDDVMESLNNSELAQRRFREIARISGLVFQGFPGAPRSTRQLQASSSLFYEVFRKHDGGNLLLGQAQREVLEQELELGRLRECMEQLQKRRLAFVEIARPTPFAFPLMIERLREAMSNEKLSDRIARMVKELERAAR
jgi:ATP-dependent helicase Lhr and Lhr-like helicase